MPAMESDCLFQKAVLWAATTTFADDNSLSVSAAAEINVRWEDTKIEDPDGKGNVTSIVAEVVVGQDIAIGSIMWLGELEDIASPPVNLRKVINFSKIPDVKGRKFRRTVQLMRFHNTLPTIV